MNTAVPIGRFMGSEIRAHWTWVIALAVLVVLGENLAADPTIGLDTNWAWASAILAAALVFVSVVLHEISHIWSCRRNGLDGGVAVIQLVGGTYLSDVRPRTAGQEFRISAIGPLVSVIVTGFFGLAAGALIVAYGNVQDVPQEIAAAAAITQLVFIYNLFVLLVNLVPGYPFDGARIVHAIAWSRTGSEEGATAASSRVSRLVGMAVVLLGALVAVEDLIPGIVIAVAGWFTMISSRVMDRRLVLKELVAGAHVSDALDDDVPRVPPQLTLDVYASEYLAERFGAAALVERGEQLLGLIGTAQIRRIPRRKWQLTRTEQAMVPLTDVPHARLEDDLWPALESMERSGLDGLLIDAGERVTSLLTRRSAARLIRERAQRQATFGRGIVRGLVITNRRNGPPPTAGTWGGPPWDGTSWQGPSSPPPGGEDVAGKPGDTAGGPGSGEDEKGDQSGSGEDGHGHGSE